MNLERLRVEGIRVLNSGSTYCLMIAFNTHAEYGQGVEGRFIDV